MGNDLQISDTIFTTVNLFLSLFFPFFFSLFFPPTSGRKMQVALFFLLVIIASAGVGNACIQPPCPNQYGPTQYIPGPKRWTKNRESNNIHAMKKTRMMMMKKMMAMNTAENDEEY